MLEVGKTYRCEGDAKDIFILAKLPIDIKSPKYHNFAVYFVDPETKATEPGELSLHDDIINKWHEVKE